MSWRRMLKADDLPTKSRSEYKRLAHIGRGSFADVYLCEHVESGEQVCMKEVDLTFRSAVEREQCFNEVAVLKHLPAHPNIVAFREAFWAGFDESDVSSATSTQILVLVLEYADNGDLEQQLAVGDITPTDEMEIRRIFMELAHGVNHLKAHGVMHRDIKSCNVLLFRSKRVVLGDFGTSKLVPPIKASQNEVDEPNLATTFVGSPLYMSPELLDGEPYGFATDIWSLGCVLYDLLSGGRPAFAAPSYPAVVFRITRGEYDPLNGAIISPQVQDLLARMLRKEPRDRPSIEEVLQSSWLSDQNPLILSVVGESLEPSKSQVLLQPLDIDERDFCGGLKRNDFLHVVSNPELPRKPSNLERPSSSIPPPAPVHTKPSQSSREHHTLNKHSYDEHHAPSRIAYPLIQLDLQPPPAPTLHSVKRLSTPPSIPCKHKKRQEFRSPVTTMSPVLEVRGIHFKRAARPTQPHH